MDGDIEKLPFRHVERPQMRDMELRGLQGREHTQEDVEAITEAFDKLRANEPETVLDIAVRVMQPCGRIAVGMTVVGTHAELHMQANEWVKLLGADESRVGYEWLIGH